MQSLLTKPIYQFDQTEKTEITSFKKGKGKGQKSKGQKGKGSKGSSSFQKLQRKIKGKGKTKSKGKGWWTTWSWGQNQQNASWGQGQNGQKGSKSGKMANQPAQFVENQDIPQISTLRINQLRPYLQISSEVFEIYDLKLNNSSIRT